MEPTEIIKIIADVSNFVETHPVLSGLAASAVVATESLPWVKKVEANSVGQLLINIAKTVFKFITKKKGV